MDRRRQLCARESTWILYNVQKYKRRTDYSERLWFEDWKKALSGTSAGVIDANTLKTDYQRDVILLDGDDDFTAADKQQYVADFSRDRDAALLALGGHHLNALRNAIEAASTNAVPLKSGAKGSSAINSPEPTILEMHTSEASKVLVPGRLASALSKQCLQ